MPAGRPKAFDPDEVIERARDLFWRVGYGGASITALEDALGIGRKSLYDTFGSKRALYVLALGSYVETVVDGICAGLAGPAPSPLANLERVLSKLQRHHGSPASRGCLLGVAMAESVPGEGVEPAVRRALVRLERAFERTLAAARDAGELRADVEPRDHARALVALTQGIALMGRAGLPASTLAGAVRAALDGLRP